MSAYWISLTPQDLPLVLHKDEREAILQDDQDDRITASTILGVTASVRECIAQSSSNILDANPDTIPITLRDVALDIIAVRLLKRFDLDLSEERANAADKADAKLALISSKQHRVISPSGDIPSAPSSRPHVTAPNPAYEADGRGIYPTPRRRP